MPAQVRVYDATLRGARPAGNTGAVDIARRLASVGVVTIEAGYPASGNQAAEAVRRVAEAIRACEVAALARCVPEEIDAAADAVEPAAQPVIHVFMDAGQAGDIGRAAQARAAVVRMIERGVARARARVPIVQFSVESAAAIERPFLKQCVETAVLAGARRIGLGGVSGPAGSDAYAALIGDIVRFVDRDVTVSASCHGNQAIAGTVAAIAAGARQIEVAAGSGGELPRLDAIAEAVAATVGGMPGFAGCAQAAGEIARLLEPSHATPWRWGAMPESAATAIRPAAAVEVAFL
ncbi:MAG: hypothetical protein JXR94_05395 [Candidatus Hydrogenedentes bacterium]|nr:hypothetical protein [Candidatus Hydrogenedentota bacterium]